MMKLLFITNYIIIIKKYLVSLDQPSASQFPSDFGLLNDLKNICIQIPLLQEIKDIPIYKKCKENIFETTRKKEKRSTYSTFYWKIS